MKTINSADAQYFNLLEHILKNGIKKTDRTGTGTISVFDYTMRFNMVDGFPLLTSKKVHTKSIIIELIWFLKGDTNIKYLIDNGVHIWDGDAYKNYQTKDKLISDKKEVSHLFDGVDGAWTSDDVELSKEEFINKIKSDGEFAKKWGELGPIYGKQWRKVDKKNDKYEPIDQIQNLINELKTNPDSRRLMVSAWNVGEIDEMVLPPCHYGFQCYTQEMSLEDRKKSWCDSQGKSIHYIDNMEEELLKEIPKRKLSLKVTIRSNDVFLGNPFNISSYAILLHLLSNEVNMIPNELIISIGDAHIYVNHIDSCKKQLSQETYPLPKIEITKKSIFDIGLDDIKIIGYKSSPPIKGELSN